MTMSCIRCGCTETHACMTADGPCAWVSEDPPICSACLDVGAGEPECSRSRSGYHQPFFRADGSAYCIHCRGELDTREAA